MLSKLTPYAVRMHHRCYRKCAARADARFGELGPLLKFVWTSNVERTACVLAGGIDLVPGF